MTNELLPDYIFEKEFCELCGDESKDLRWDHNDNLVCQYCQENLAFREDIVPESSEGVEDAA